MREGLQCVQDLLWFMKMEDSWGLQRRQEELPELLNEFKVLSNADAVSLSSLHETSPPVAHTRKRKADDDQQYPILFEALDACFGLMPSNERIAKQAHGLLRYMLEKTQTSWRADAEATYKFDCYGQNQKVRESMKQNREERSKKKQKFEGVTVGSHVTCKGRADR